MRLTFYSIQNINGYSKTEVVSKSLNWYLPPSYLGNKHVVSVQIWEINTSSLVLMLLTELPIFTLRRKLLFNTYIHYTCCPELKWPWLAILWSWISENMLLFQTYKIPVIEILYNCQPLGAHPLHPKWTSLVKLKLKDVLINHISISISINEMFDNFLRWIIFIQ